MTREELREQAVQDLTEMLRHNPFTFEFKVVKKPKGIKVIYEVTQSQMERLLKEAQEKRKEG